ncbi:FAD binding domain-containing protein [Xylariaceae sp. FL0016]|nr:FAD binding domain-containing protein [Xylariaceae sp. FL0016]
MSLRYVIGLFLPQVLALAVRNSLSQSCRSIPGDASWPSPSQWDSLNQTVGGKLIATTPIASPCHTTLYNQENPGFDEEQCAALRDVWYYPETHLPSPSSPMAYQFTNNSCNPFLDPDTPCDIGYYVAYTINATTTTDIQAGIAFVEEHNIRLVIRNSGHDYLGKSTGAHALAIWTHYMKSLELVESYSGPGDYSGVAIKAGAGIEDIEAYEFAQSNGLMVAGGNCPSVGLTGGFTQGGGISILSSRVGMGADQALEFEVVTGKGEILTANADENADLFWALRGGGGGTYGVVTSMTAKAYSDTYFSVAYLTVIKNGTNEDALYGSLGTFLQSLPSLVDAGAWVVFVGTPEVFLIMPAMGADLHPADLDALLKPFLDKMDSFALEYTYSSAEYPDFLSGYNSMTSTWNVSDNNLASRLIPRELVKSNESTEALVAAIRSITTETIMSGVAFNAAGGVASADDVAVNPYFRKTLFSATLGTTIDYTDFEANKAAQDRLTYDLVPRLKALTPDGAAYLNEGDFQEPDFQTAFYGSHYDQLLSIKNKYDPKDIFYAKTAVGSDSWAQGLE